ncbi:MAG: hypothetical protein WAZ12_04940 [Candidatus Absconditicoccaceae bacterium]
MFIVLDCVMIIGNKESTNTLIKYLDNFVKEEKQSIPFFIISGPKNIGKTTCIIELIKNYLGQYFMQDFLYIKDLTDNIGLHNLKVRTPKENDKRFLNINDNELYEDLGVRDINLRLQQSKIGPFKTVLLENIERMVPEAANAFLKTCEEPLAGRIIFATTSHQSQLLDTIISRAILIKFQELTNDEMLQFMSEKGYFQGDEEFSKFVCHMAMGRPGVVVKLNDIFENNDGLKQDFIKLVDILSSKKSIFYAQDILKNLNNHGYIDGFIDGWIAYCVENDMFDQAQRRLKVKKMIKNNVGIENLILYGVL